MNHPATIRPLNHFDAGRFQEIASGYTTAEIYRVTRAETAERTTIELLLQALPEPREFRYEYDDEEIERYGRLVPGEFSLGAYDGETLAAVALAEPSEWNSTLWVWEFHVAERYRGQGVGRSLMAELAARAKRHGCRAIVCETQNTNVPAIRFYRATGFTMDGVDTSYYSNEDMLPGNTVAVFMKLKLA